MEQYDVVVMGTGPAGLTAALYLSRSNFVPLVLGGQQPGGQLTITTDVENFPGFPDGIMGGELIDKMIAQAKKFDAKFEDSTVVDVDFSHRPFRLTVEDLMGKKREIHTQALVIATGASARFLGMTKEKELMGYGVSGCATCDGAFYRDKEVIVVGGGDTAMEEAIFLTRFAKQVTIVHRREGFRASAVMLEKARKNPKIAWNLNKVVHEINGDREHGLQSVVLKDTQNGELSTVKVDGLFIAIGHEPNTKWARGKLEMDEKGYITTQPCSTHTSVEGVFACGDVSDPHYRQAITAAGSGCMAAIDVKNFLE